MNKFYIYKFKTKKAEKLIHIIAETTTSVLCFCTLHIHREYYVHLLKRIKYKNQ